MRTSAIHTVWLRPLTPEERESIMKQRVPTEREWATCNRCKQYISLNARILYEHKQICPPPADIFWKEKEEDDV